MDAAGALAKRAASQLTRMQRLIRSRAASEDELDVAQAEADSTKRLHEAAVIAHRRLVAGPRAEQVAQAQNSQENSQEKRSGRSSGLWLGLHAKTFSEGKTSTKKHV